MSTAAALLVVQLKVSSSDGEQTHFLVLPFLVSGWCTLFKCSGLIGVAVYDCVVMCWWVIA